MNLLARWTNRKILRIATRHPDFATERNYRSAHDGGFYDFLFFDVVGKSLVISRLDKLRGRSGIGTKFASFRWCALIQLGRFLGLVFSVLQNYIEGELDLVSKQFNLNFRAGWFLPDSRS